MAVSIQDTDISLMFRRGLASHNAGNLSAANKIYHAILDMNPHHSEANHNIGIILVARNKFEKALYFFKLALDSSPNVNLFWASYIDTLVKLERIIEAKLLIKASKSAGLFCESIRAISQYLDVEYMGPDINELREPPMTMGQHGQLVSNIGCEQKNIFIGEDGALDKVEKTAFSSKMALSAIATITNFYKNRSNDIITAAARGWFFTSSFDKKFIGHQQSYNFSNNTRNIVINETLCINPKSTDLGLDVNQTIEYLGQYDSPIDRFNKLKSLIKSNNVHLISDSFSQYLDVDISFVQEQTFTTEGFNIVIIGAGASGLFLANIIKSGLGKAVNVLVLDNRSSKKNTREIFSRNWLTHIPVTIVEKLTPQNVKGLFSCFGKNGLIGIPINALETILMLSCKDQGVKFYFSPNLDLENLNNESIDCFFDATAGHLKGSNYQSAKEPNLPVQMKNTSLDFSAENIKQLDNLPCFEVDYLKIMLKSSGHLYYPYVENSKIHTHMFKLTGVPINLLKVLRDFVKPRNVLNLFYIWEGTLIDEINEGLILINLTNQEYEILTTCIYKPMSIGLFLKNNTTILPLLNEDILTLIEILGDLDTHGLVRLEIPFTYSPYINLDSESGQFNGKPIFPIGDSLFCGHPKVGNGLAEHLDLLNDLVLELIRLRKPTS